MKLLIHHFLLSYMFLTSVLSQEFDQRSFFGKRYDLKRNTNSFKSQIVFLSTAFCEKYIKVRPSNLKAKASVKDKIEISCKKILTLNRLAEEVNKRKMKRERESMIYRTHLPSQVYSFNNPDFLTV